MGFRNGCYASVFSVKKGKGNYYDVSVTTSKKNRQTNNYETDFSGFVRFIGEAANAIAKFDGKDSKSNGNKPLTRVKLGSVDVTNSYNKEKKITYYNPVVFAFEFADGTANATSSDNKDINDYVNTTPDAEDELFT